MKRLFRNDHVKTIGVMFFIGMFIWSVILTDGALLGVVAVACVVTVVYLAILTTIRENR